MKKASWGPPYYKFKKTFPDGKEEPAKTAANLAPEKKTA